MYGLLVAIHILGVAMWLGSGFTYAIWSSRGRNVANLDVTAFVFRTIARTQAAITVPGMFLTVISGVILTFVGPYGWFDPAQPWLFAMQAMGLLAFVLALLVLYPRSIRVARLAEQGVRRGHQDADFYAINRQQAVLSSVVGLLLVAIIVVVYVLRLP
ncbi:MAG TPA: DUF2269 family protein [Chloroflexota bacterium]|nr:DUF2269 family protein [Chloroflexota bacterium]